MLFLVGHQLLHESADGAGWAGRKPIRSCFQHILLSKDHGQGTSKRTQMDQEIWHFWEGFHTCSSASGNALVPGSKKICFIMEFCRIAIFLFSLEWQSHENINQTLLYSFLYRWKYLSINIRKPIYLETEICSIGNIQHKFIWKVFPVIKSNCVFIELLWVKQHTFVVSKIFNLFLCLMFQVIDMQKKEINYYDSMGGRNDGCLHALK